MSLEIAWKQVALGFGLQTFICGFSRQNICSVDLNLQTLGGVLYD